MTPQQKYYRTAKGQAARSAWRKRRYARQHQVLVSLKARPCADCGRMYPHYVMDFDHVRGQKKYPVSHIGRQGMRSLLEEIDKCEVVCANCHRERTWNTRQRKRAKAA